MELYLRVRPGHERPEQGEAGRVASWQLGSGVRDLAVCDSVCWRSGVFP